MTVVQRPLDLPEPEFTEEQLRIAHAELPIRRSFESWMSTPWGPPLLKCQARATLRREARSRK